MNIIGIDPSLISTAVVIGNDKEFKIFNYCKEDNISTKTGLKKWYKSCEQYVTYKNITYDNYDNYSNGEIIKLHDYNKITDNIIIDILDNINPNEKTKIGIEGYSFASNFGDIIDLVTFSTLLRSKIIDKITKDLTIISPSSLKLESCKLTYKPINIGKKKEKLKYVNDEGMSGGSFTKREMFLSIVENDNLNDYWSNYLKSVKEEIFSNKSIPKPHEDINDSILLFNILKNNKLS